MNGRFNFKKGKSDGDKDIIQKLLFKNNNYSSLYNQRIKTTYNNNRTKSNNLKIINKKNANKREEILNTLNNNKGYSIFGSAGLPPVNTQKNFNNVYYPKNTFNLGIKNSFNTPYSIPRDKEGLILELYHVTNDMDVQNKELEDSQKEYNNLISNSLAYKTIIEKILELDENGNNINGNNRINTLKNREKSKSENNFRSINTIDENEEFTPLSTLKAKSKNIKRNKINNTSYISTIKNNKSKFILKNLHLNDIVNPTTINVLSRQNTDLNKILIDKEKILIEIKNDEKKKNFDEYISLLNEKNNQLEVLVNQSKKLQYKQYEIENQINSYITKLEKITHESNSVNDKLKINKNDLENLKKEIESLLRYKEELKEKEIKLNEDEKQNKNNLKEKQKKENEINNLLKEKQKYFDEQEKINMQIKDLQKQEDNIKKTLDKKNNSIKGIKKENEDLEKQIIYYEERRSKLLQKADQPRKNRIRMKEMENEIKVLENNIISYKVESDEKEKNMEETEEKNNERIKMQEEEIDNHPNIIKELETEISNLKNELKNLEDDKNKKEEELSKLKDEYNNVIEQTKQEKENKEKIKKEKEIQESKDEDMKNKQNEEKYNEFIKNKKELSDEAEKEKLANNKIKEENKKLKDLQKEKMELFKLTNEKHAQLEKLLNEIKNLSEKS